MAHVSQDKKKIIAAVLKVALKDFPSVKYTLAVQHHSTLVVTIKSGPECLDADKKGHKRVNEYYIGDHYAGDAAKIFKLIKGASDSVNHDRSDSQSDYFDVGHYLTINVGAWDKPYISV